MHPRVKIYSSSHSNWLYTEEQWKATQLQRQVDSLNRAGGGEWKLHCALFQAAALQCQQSAPTGQKGQQAAVEQSRREETIPLVEQARSRSAVANQRPTVSCSQVSHHLFCPPLSFDQVLCFASTLALWVIFGIWTKKWTPCERKPAQKQTNLIKCFSQSIIVSIAINKNRVHNRYQNNLGKLILR